jgi:hypothetical protein
MRESVAWYLADPSRQKVDPTIDAAIDTVLAAWDGNPGHTASMT